MDYNTLLSSYALYKSVPGETFTVTFPAQSESCENTTVVPIEPDLKCLYSTKYELNNNYDESDSIYSCGCGDQQVIIPIRILNAFNNTGFACTFMVPSGNRLIAVDNNKPRSDIIVIDIYQYLDLNSSKPMRSGEVTDECDPFFITFDLSNDKEISLNETADEIDWQLNKGNVFISCDFWNVTTNQWESNGCYVYNISKQTGLVTCACIHLTAFSVSYKPFIPQSNQLTQWHWRQITIDNLIKYPTVLITITSILVLFIFLCLLSSIYRERE
eukprot:526540_1